MLGELYEIVTYMAHNHYDTKTEPPYHPLKSSTIQFLWQVHFHSLRYVLYNLTHSLSSQDLSNAAVMIGWIVNMKCLL